MTADYAAAWQAPPADDGGPRFAELEVGNGPTLVRLSTVAAERVTWLWQSRLPAGKLTVLDGDPGVGKSTLAVAMAAHVSTGRPWPDGTPCPHGDVLILSAEDGLADTVRPRLDAAGGDPTRVHALTGVRWVSEDSTTYERPVTLADVDPIRAAVERVRARLVVVDVLMAYLPAGTDSHRDQDVRTVLARLAQLGEDTGCSLLLLRHLNKATGGSPLYRGGGSIGIVGAARSGLLAAIDPDDETRRVLSLTKSNLAPEPESLAYRLTSAPNGCAAVKWEGVTAHRAADLLSRREDDDERGERDEATAWLLDYLQSKGGEAASRDIYKAARAEGIAERTLKRARHRARVESVRSGFPSTTVWSVRPQSGQLGQPSDPGPSDPTVAPLAASEQSAAALLADHLGATEIEQVS